MTVECYCDYDYEWFYDAPQDFSELGTKRRQRCTCCRTLIDIGSDVGKFHAWRSPRSDIEENIYGDEVPMADFYLCEECFGLYLSVVETGACVTMEKGRSMKEQIRDWLDERN